MANSHSQNKCLYFGKVVTLLLSHQNCRVDCHTIIKADTNFSQTNANLSGIKPPLDCHSSTSSDSSSEHDLDDHVSDSTSLSLSPLISSIPVSSEIVSVVTQTPDVQATVDNSSLIIPDTPDSPRPSSPFQISSPVNQIPLTSSSTSELQIIVHPLFPLPSYNPSESHPSEEPLVSDNQINEESTADEHVFSYPSKDSSLPEEPPSSIPSSFSPPTTATPSVPSPSLDPSSVNQSSIPSSSSLPPSEKPPPSSVPQPSPQIDPTTSSALPPLNSRQQINLGVLGNNIARQVTQSLQPFLERSFQNLASHMNSNVDQAFHTFTGQCHEDLSRIARQVTINLIPEIERAFLSFGNQVHDELHRLTRLQARTARSVEEIRNFLRMPPPRDPPPPPADGTGPSS